MSAKFCCILNKCTRVCLWERKGGTGEFCLTSASVSKRSLRKMLSLAQANKFPHLASVSWTFSEFSSHHRLHKILPNKDWISCNTILKKKKKERREGKRRDEKKLDKLLSEVLKCKISFRAVARRKAFYRAKENTVYILSPTMTWKLWKYWTCWLKRIFFHCLVEGQYSSQHPI